MFPMSPNCVRDSDNAHAVAVDVRNNGDAKGSNADVACGSRLSSGAQYQRLLSRDEQAMNRRGRVQPGETASNGRLRHPRASVLAPILNTVRLGELPEQRKPNYFKHCRLKAGHVLRKGNYVVQNNLRLQLACHLLTRHHLSGRNSEHLRHHYHRR